MDKRSFHIPIHILYWFINRHFYKTMKSSCLNKTEKILMSKINRVGLIFLYFLIFFLNVSGFGDWGAGLFVPEGSSDGVSVFWQK